MRNLLYLNDIEHSGLYSDDSLFDIYIYFYEYISYRLERPMAFIAMAVESECLLYIG